jgi:predicted NBD/HSP70 family sugar kinase
LKSYISSDLKELNRETVYNVLKSEGEISRAEIVRRTKISPPTVLKIVSYFLEAGFISEAGEGQSSLGRKPQLLLFNPEARFSIGVEYEGDFIKAGIVDLSGNVKASRQKRVYGQFDEVINKELHILIHDLIKDTNIPMKRILGIGIGIPAIVDRDKNVVSAAPLVGILQDVDCNPILRKLSDEFGLDVYIENDVNAAAIGEFIARKMSKTSDLIYISLGTGLGAGVILHGKLRRGITNSCGEIAYAVFDKDFVTSTDRSGWLEGCINVNALTKRWPFFKRVYEGESFAKYENTSEYHLLIDYVAGNLALEIANMISLLDLDTVILGGTSIKLLGYPLLEAINKYLSRLCSTNVSCKLQQCVEPCIAGSAMISTRKKLKEVFSG